MEQLLRSQANAPQSMIGKAFTWLGRREGQRLHPAVKAANILVALLGIVGIPAANMMIFSLGSACGSSNGFQRVPLGMAWFYVCYYASMGFPPVCAASFLASLRAGYSGHSNHAVAIALMPPLATIGIVLLSLWMLREP